MCDRPISIQVTDEQDRTETIEVACRKCDRCIASRKNTWVARAMAEKASAGEAITFTLTYAPLPNGQKPLGARVFRDRDITLFLKLVREMYFEKYGKRGEISFLCAGEQGSQGTRRVHWHLILFAKRPIGPLGEWTDVTKKNKIQFDDIWNMKNDHRVHWSLWPHGHVNLMRPDASGMSYVIKYMLKDQFNSVNAKGTRREAKAQNHAASKVRMSRNPPMGQRYLEAKTAEWEADLVVPPTLQITVPDYTGYWYPQRKQREYLLTRLWEINQRCNEVKGRDCVQWSALLSGVANNQQEPTIETLESKEWELLTDGPEKEETEIDRAWRVGTEYAKIDEYFDNKIEREQNAALRRKYIRRCGHYLPCTGCKHRLAPKELASLRTRYEDARTKYNAENGFAENNSFEFSKDWRSQYVISEGCKNRNDKQLKSLFANARATENLRRKNGET